MAIPSAGRAVVFEGDEPHFAFTLTYSATGTPFIDFASYDPEFHIVDDAGALVASFPLIVVDDLAGKVKLASSGYVYGEGPAYEDFVADWGKLVAGERYRAQIYLKPKDDSVSKRITVQTRIPIYVREAYRNREDANA